MNKENLKNKKIYEVLKNICSHYCSSKEIKEVIYYLIDGVGYGSEYTGFTFWSDLDEYDKSFYDTPFRGLELNYLDDTVVVDFHTLYYYIEEKMNNCLNFKSEEKKEILKKLKTTFNNKIEEDKSFCRK